MLQHDNIFFLLTAGLGRRHHPHFNTRTWDAEQVPQLYLTQLQWLTTTYTIMEICWQLQ